MTVLTDRSRFRGALVKSHSLAREGMNRCLLAAVADL